MSLAGRSVAWLNLAWNFGRHVLVQLPARAFGGGRDAQRFRDAVIPEGYVPLAPQDRALLPHAMRCINCGLCALACDDLATRPASAWDEAWTFAAGTSRSLDHAPLVDAHQSACARDARAAAVCPTGVPIPEMRAMITRLATTLTVALAMSMMPADVDAQQRPRAREAGVIVGTLTPGAHNAITDVAGVRVGHVTVRGETGNTGVTAILPPGDDWFRERVPASMVIGNGFGKLIGYSQVHELGELETPILLTCTLCVWRAADAMVEWLIARPNMQNVRSINPVVGETNDGSLNDIRARPITPEHVKRALESAAAGPVEEGAVGAGAGTVAFGWKGGIGTSSRIVQQPTGSYTVGVLVQSNFGGSLRIMGAPVGRELRAQRGDPPAPEDGSIMMIVATDAPLDARLLRRLADRALVGLARTGSSMSNGSGDYVIAFSTAESVRRRNATGTQEITQLGNESMSGLFAAVADATEEAIYNSLFKATTTTWRNTTVEALPIERTLDVLRRYGMVR